MTKSAGILLTVMPTLSVMAGRSQSTSGTVTTDSSTSMEKVIGALGETFETQNNGVTLAPVPAFMRF